MSNSAPELTRWVSHVCCESRPGYTTNVCVTLGTNPVELETANSLEQEKGRGQEWSSQGGRIKQEEGNSSYKGGKKQNRTEKIWEEKIWRYYVYQSTLPHKTHKDLTTVFMLRTITVDYVHGYTNNNYGITAIVLITVVINPLIISALSRRSPWYHWCISACLQGQQAPADHQQQDCVENPENRTLLLNWFEPHVDISGWSIIDFEFSRYLWHSI